jgi:Ca-activated chloride channel family protein
VTASKHAARAYAPSLERRPFPGTYQDVGRDKFTMPSPRTPFKIAREEPVSTFSIDVDTASYSFVRASLNQNVLPQPAAVRTEEMVNYFPYDYARRALGRSAVQHQCRGVPEPVDAGRKLVRIGMKGYEIQRATRPRANLVFLIDTSGSMNAPNKLPLVKQSLNMLLDQLERNDSVAIVTYAGMPAPRSSRPRRARRARSAR